MVSRSDIHVPNRKKSTRHSVFIGAISGITVAGQSGVPGSWAYQLRSPTSITFDQLSNMYILDSGNNRIQRWAPGAAFGTTVASSSSLYNPRGLTIDPLGNLVVADDSYHRILSFSVLCRELSKF